MALNINWRFAGPQDIKVPQSNVLQSFDKNIQKGLEIKKEFDKKRDDDAMIRLMTEEAENKLTKLNNEKDELITQYNLLSLDEQSAQKTNFENKLNELDAQINLAEKEVLDARMSANQFKTTGTTDFFRWKKDKEYAAETAAVNRDAINAQIKAETLSNLNWEIKAKEAELKRSNDTDTTNRLNDELNLLKEQYNKEYGQTYYKINAVEAGKQEGAEAGKQEVTGNKKSPESIIALTDKLTWQENLANSADVKEIQDEIDKYTQSTDRSNLQDKLDLKIKELNDAKAKELADEEAANKNKTAAAIKAKADAKKDLETLYKNEKAPELLGIINDAKYKYTDLQGKAKEYLINVLGKTQTGKLVTDNTPSQAAYTKYNGNDAMQSFIKDNIKAINAVQAKK